MARLAWAEAQRDELMAALDGAPGDAVAVFFCKTMCGQRTDESSVTCRFVQPGPRRPLAALLERRRPAFVASVS